MIEEREQQADELEREIDAIEKHLLIEALESSLLVRPSRGKRLMQEADEVLTRWAKEYRSGDAVQIKKLTGWQFGSLLGRLYKKGMHGEEPMDDKEYQRVNGVVFSLSRFSRSVIVEHYQDRKKSVAEHIVRTGVSKTTYYRNLQNAKLEFVAKGGIG